MKRIISIIIICIVVFISLLAFVQSSFGSPRRSQIFNGLEYYQIINKVSGYGLLPEYSGVTPGKRGMHHWPMGEGTATPEAFLWEIKTAGKIRGLNDIETDKLGDLAKLKEPELTSRSMPPGSTSPVLAKRAIIPFFLVSDLSYNEAWKIENSPYYILEREDYFRHLPEYYKDDDTNFEGGDKDRLVANEREVSYETGFTKEASQEFSQKTGISLTVGTTATVGGKIYPWSVSVEMSATANAEWGLTRSFTETMTSTKKVTDKVIYYIGQATAVWQAWSKFYLRRLDGSLVNSWEAATGGMIIRRFP